MNLRQKDFRFKTNLDNLVSKNLKMYLKELVL